MNIPAWPALSRATNNPKIANHVNPNATVMPKKNRKPAKMLIKNGITVRALTQAMAAAMLTPIITAAISSQ